MVPQQSDERHITGRHSWVQRSANDTKCTTFSRMTLKSREQQLIKILSAESHLTEQQLTRMTFSRETVYKMTFIRKTIKWHTAEWPSTEEHLAERQ